MLWQYVITFISIHANKARSTITITTSNSTSVIVLLSNAIETLTVEKLKGIFVVRPNLSADCASMKVYK